jgi:ADP-dependent phosphofructokinase/glucokinase
LQNSFNQVKSANGVFVGYNACIDFLEYLEHQSLEQIYKEETTPEILTKLANVSKLEYPQEIKNKEDFLFSLIKSLSSGKAKQIPTYVSSQMNKWFNRVFAEADEHRMGGQSGIIANLLSQLGVNTIVYIPNLSYVQARRFHSQNILFPIKSEDLGVMSLRNITKCGQEDAITKINWIFEYEEGLNFPIEKLSEFITAPRSNRLIIADRPKGLFPGFSNELEPYLPELGSLVDRALLSGYQYLTEDNVNSWMNREQSFLKKFVSRNPDLRIHLEFASISNEVVRKTIIEKLKNNIHSLGCNEVELATILHDLGEFEAETAVSKNESIETIYDGMNIVKKSLGIPRFHLHTLSYHVILINANYCKNVSIDSVQNAALYSALIGTAKTLVGEFTSRNIKDFEIKLATQFPVSYNGVKNLEKIALKLKKEDEISDIKEFMSNGIINNEKIWKLVIPTQLTPADQLKSTVGLGDSISSTAFTFDCKK